jgi:acetyl-CoA acetyltransferase
MFDAIGEVAVVGVGHSAIGRRLERPLGLLALDACRAAIEDAGLSPEEIDGITTYPDLPASGHGAVEDGVNVVTTPWMIRNLGVKELNYWGQLGYGNVSTAIGEAIRAIATGCCDTALVFRALHLPRGGNYTQFTGSSASGAAAYTAPYGAAHAPLNFALNSYMRYQRLFGARREHLAAYVLAARRGANANRYAYFRAEPLTLADYMGARMIADPLCLYDCDIPVDGAGAIVLASAERARRLRQTPAYVTGYGQAGWAPTAVPIDQLWHTARTLGSQLWASSRLRPHDMSGAMLYDGFAPDIYFWLEGMGFCEQGTAYDWIQDGRLERTGYLPINTFGGSLSEGRLHGIGHWIEGALQVQGRAETRQIPDVEHIVVATGMLQHGSGAILSVSPTR